MRIVLIGRYGEGDIIAGPERVARELFAGLRELGQDVMFIEYFFKGYVGSSLGKRIWGQKKVSSDNTIKRMGIFPMLWELITKKYDVVHFINLQRFLIFIFPVKPLIKSKFVYTSHGLIKIQLRRKIFFTNRTFIDIQVEKLTIKKSDLVIFPSSVLMQEFKHHYRVLGQTYRIIPNGVQQIFNKPHNSFVPIADLITLVFYNGFNDFINRGLNELYDLLKHSGNKIKIYIIGNYDHDIRTEESLEVIYTEPKNQKELIEFLKDKHIIIKADVLDSFSILVAECMCLGIIPVITNKTGIKDYIKNGENGFIYNQSFPHTFGLIGLLNDITDGKYDLNLISGNAKKIFEQLNWSNITSKYIEAYKGLK